MAIALRYAALSDIGLVRSNNQDSAYAGPHLLVVADGMGGHAGGDVASSLAIGELAPLDEESHGGDALEHLAGAVARAHDELLDRVDEEPALAGMGTTVTALLRSGNRFALAHIGDSRAYLLRQGVLVQLTKDHTFVQTLVDEGRITAEEAEHHPQRSVLMRVLSDVVDDVTPDLSMREARPGDRYLLCSDGLSSFVSAETLGMTLAQGEGPTATCEALVALAIRAGAPDNVTCIVADVVEDSAYGDSTPYVVGAASVSQPLRNQNAASTPAERAAALTGVRPIAQNTNPAPSAPSHKGKVWGSFALVLVMVVAGGFLGWRWVNSQFFVGDAGGAVAIYSGLPESFGPVQLSRVQTVADVPLSDLPDYARTEIQNGVPADSRAGANELVDKYRLLAERCKELRTPTGAPALAPTDPSSAQPTPSLGQPAPGFSPTGATGRPTASGSVQPTAGTPTSSVTTPAPTASTASAPSTGSASQPGASLGGSSATEGSDPGAISAQECGGLVS